MINGMLIDLVIATQAAPPTPSVSLPHFVIGLVSVVLAVAGIAWKAGRAVATKDDLATLKDEVDPKALATKDDLAALKSENEKAHAGITENVMENRRRIDGISESMQAIARDVAFTAGRMHERDVRRPDLDDHRGGRKVTVRE